MFYFPVTHLCTLFVFSIARDAFQVLFFSSSLSVSVSLRIFRSGVFLRSPDSAFGSSKEPTDSIIQSTNALCGMRDIFEQQDVDMYEFALMQNFLSAMPPDMQSQWNRYKVKKKEEHKLRFTAAEAEGQSINEWKSGMVENCKDFTAWLTLFKSQKPIGFPEQSPAVSTAENFAIQSDSSQKSSIDKNRCFLCKEANTDNHILSRCPKGQNMTLFTWKATCRREKRCIKCAKPFTPGHNKSCKAYCTICRGKSYDNEHHVLMCPMNMHRSFPPDPMASKMGQSGPPKKGNKRKNEQEGDAQLAKIVKLVGTEIGNKFSETIKKELKTNKPQQKRSNSKEKDDNSK